MRRISLWDLNFAKWIRNHLHHSKLSWLLSRINRGETFTVFLILFFYIYRESFEYFQIFFHILIFSFLTDRSVLILKKAISRVRPLVQVLDQKDQNPDMKHSFPSAHSANSMVVVVILIFAYGVPDWFWIFTLFAGIGRLLSLHHFPSDIIGGWVVGSIWGFLGIKSFPILLFLIQNLRRI